jgi:hypothetical protein
MVHLCAAGLGPDKLFVLMIDPDAANGNLKRTNDLIDLYNTCRGILNSPNLKIFKTNIQSASVSTGRNPRHWSPIHSLELDHPDDRERNLRNYFEWSGLDDTSREICNLLYSEEEIELPLTQGFKGHPNIGAPVMARLKEELNKEPLKSMLEKMKADVGAAGESAKVFIIASAFGGTGAAGFPVVAHIIREQSKEWTQRRRLNIGGALILPYFVFSEPEDKEEKVYARPENFLVNTQAALLHYSYMGPELKSYNAIYYLGESKLSQIEKYCSGGRDQLNPPHYIELLTSLAAQHFFGQTIPENVQEQIIEHYYLPRQIDHQVEWNDIPSFEEVRHRFIFFSTFAIAGLTFYFPLLDLLKLKKNISKDYTVPWYIDHFNHDELQDGNAIKERENLSSMLRSFLIWIMQIHKHPPVEIKLFNTEALESLNKTNYNSLDDALFKRLLADSEGSKKNGYDSFWVEMCKFREDLRGKFQSPNGRLVALLYNAAKEFCDKNYKLKLKR